jgi:hypothetical protein
LEEVAGSVGDETLGWRPVPTRWSVKEILCHLRDFERDAMHIRYRSMLMEDEPYLAQLDNEAKQAEGDYIHQDGLVVLSQIRSLRLETIALLEGAPDGSWWRTGRHFSAGRISLEQAVGRHVIHDMKHLGQVRDILGLKVLA